MSPVKGYFLSSGIISQPFNYKMQQKKLMCPDLEKKLITQKEIISIAVHQAEIRSFIYVPESFKILLNNGNNRHLDSFGLSAYMNTN